MRMFSKLMLPLAGASWLFFTGQAMAQVVGSQHDLRDDGTGQGNVTGTEEVCVFCHTPHGSATGAPVPLWNKALPAPGSYQRYSDLNLPTFDAAEAPVGSVSLACLSCHDGSQAMDSIINAPGSGGYVSSGSSFGGAAAMTGTPIPMMGTDLRDDHPISMQYGGGGITLVTHPADGVFGGTLNDPDFNDPFKATVNGNPIWWVDYASSGTAGTRDKTDMILYARDEASVTGGMQPFVECGSCHDPHNSSSFIAGSQVAFLRASNAGSAICTACHTK